jgi:hypothetical protein
MKAGQHIDRVFINHIKQGMRKLVEIGAAYGLLYVVAPEKPLHPA